jgi:hypothetical protein
MPSRRKTSRFFYRQECRREIHRGRLQLTANSLVADADIEPCKVMLAAFSVLCDETSRALFLF